MFSNKYIFLYSSAMVVVVAAILSSAAQFLKPFQERNERTEKITEILKSVKIETEKSEAEAKYDEYIVEEITINREGEIVSLYRDGEMVKGDTRAFDIELKTQLSLLEDLRAGKSEQEPKFPVFVCQKNGEEYYIIPLRGKGLWGPIWGNISFESDLNTVYGVTFGHKGETPGLGAEINTQPFMEQFYGKRIFNNDKVFTSIQVVKGGIANLSEAKQIHGVDAVSGGTITSDGVTDMLYDVLSIYVPFFEKQMDQNDPPA